MTLRRVTSRPILTRREIPAMPPEIIDPSSVFNPGAVMSGGRTVLLLRVQTRGRRTFTVPASSSDGQTFTVADQPVVFDWLSQKPEGEIFHIYDARITQVASRFFVVTAVDLADGCRLAIWSAGGDPDAGFLGLERLSFVGWSHHLDTRNGVLFPEKIGGRYFLLERPNLASSEWGPATGNQIVLSASTDLVNWDTVGPVMSGRFHYWDELIGSGPPPVKTRDGWLHLYHGIATHFAASNIYQAGCVLLDLDNPVMVLARTRDNILEPRENWELTGQVPNVVFPGGLTISHTDAEGFAPEDALVRVYYGAADTAVGLAQATVGDLITSCRQG